MVFHFFVILNKNEIFELMSECKEAFTIMKVFMGTPLILTFLEVCTPLYLYLSVIDQAMSCMLVQKKQKVEKPVYFARIVFKCTKVKYHKIEILDLEVAITTRMLIQYFHGHRVLVKSNYPVHQVLKKLDFARRMVSSSLELLEYNIRYIPTRSIKSQMLVDFLRLFSSLVGKESSHIWILSMNDASNLKGSGSEIVLEGPRDLLIK